MKIIYALGMFFFWLINGANFKYFRGLMSILNTRATPLSPSLSLCCCGALHLVLQDLVTSIYICSWCACGHCSCFYCCSDCIVSPSHTLFQCVNLQDYVMSTYVPFSWDLEKDFYLVFFSCWASQRFILMQPSLCLDFFFFFNFIFCFTYAMPFCCKIQL